MRFSSTPRGARLARHLAGARLDAWGIPYGSDAHDALTLIVAELSANAVSHSFVSGRDFRLRLSAEDATVRVEATDTRGERLPVLNDPSADDQEGGRAGRRARTAPRSRPDRPLGMVPPHRRPRKDRPGLTRRTGPLTRCRRYPISTTRAHTGGRRGT